MKLRVKDFAGAFGTGDWQRRAVQQSELRQRGGLVPIDVLMSELAVAKANDRDDWHLNAPIGRRNTWQHPGHFRRVREGAVSRLFEVNFTRSGSAWILLLQPNATPKSLIWPVRWVY